MQRNQMNSPRGPRKNNSPKTTKQFREAGAEKPVSRFGKNKKGPSAGPPPRMNEGGRQKPINTGTKRINQPKVRQEEGGMRLNRFLANSGICSRRQADEFITMGMVTVNGEVITQLGSKVNPGDDVKFDGQAIKQEKLVYVLLNKPKDYLTTTDDPAERKTVMHLVKDACKERIYPVGRLDRNTTGVLLLTNDGDLAGKLLHPKQKKKKIYQVTLDKGLKATDLDKILTGIELEDGFIKADNVEYLHPSDKKLVGIELHSGQNRVVRRIFESLGYVVTKLDRVYFAGLTKKGLERGRWRLLNEKEIAMLKMGAYQ